MGEFDFTAIIIKGNPEFVENNELADRFYGELKNYIESLGFAVNFFQGSTEQKPPFADMWVGHSMGAENLKFASSYIRTINLGNPDGIFHPNDNVHDENPPNEFHFVLTDEMKEAIAYTARRIRRLSEFQDGIIRLAEKICMK